MKSLQCACIALLVATLSGCGTWNVPAGDRSTKSEGLDAPTPEERLVAAMEQAAAANAAVAEIEAATVVSRGADLRSQGDLPANVVLPPEVMIPVSVDWNGPVETLLSDLGRRSGFRFAVNGNPPANGILVTIRARNEPIYAVLRRAGHLTHGAADISLNLETREIMMQYTY